MKSKFIINLYLFYFFNFWIYKIYGGVLFFLNYTLKNWISHRIQIYNKSMFIFIFFIFDSKGPFTTEYGGDIVTLCNVNLVNLGHKKYKKLIIGLKNVLT